MMSIWKTPDQKPEERRQILFYAGCGGLLNKGWYYTKNDAFGSYSSKNVQKWAYVDELFAQADKAERLQKAVDLAVGALKKINETYEEEYYKGDDEHDSCDWLNCADDMDDLATDVIDEIKQLIKGDKNE